MNTPTYENYPSWMVIAGIAVSVSLYVLGAFIMSGFGTLPVILYLAYCGFIEIAVLWKSCIHCAYYGKLCGLGRGKLCAFLFTRGDPKRFIEREVSWREILPDFMVSLIPLAGGVFFLVRGFDLLIATAVVLIILLTTLGNAIVRGSLACKHCMQRELGCPAERLFSKEAEENAEWPVRMNNLIACVKCQAHYPACLPIAWF